MKNIENKIKEEIKNLEWEFAEKLNELEEKLKEELKSKPNKRKKPAKGIMYWYVGCDNEIGYDYWRDTNVDNNIFNNYNIFLTREETEKAQRVRETENLLRKYIEEHDTVELDWNNTKQEKHYLWFDYRDNQIHVNYCYHFKYPRTIYTSNKQVLLDAVKEIGEERIIEYLQY